MRQRVLAAAVVIAVVVMGTAHAGKVEIKGGHICCPPCVNTITGVLKKVDGVTDPEAVKNGSITFTTKDDKTTTAAIIALADAGFIGVATDDGKEFKVDLPTPKGGDKLDSVTVTGTHICCPNCQAALKALFPDDKMEFLDKKTLKLNGDNLDKAAVLEVLRKAGFNGKIN
jgi:copper chaperone CopZ